ncbi:MAG TPA: chorismate mutase [Candidatus Eisenbacteria bacterium]
MATTRKPEKGKAGKRKSVTRGGEKGNASRKKAAPGRTVSSRGGDRASRASATSPGRASTAADRTRTTAADRSRITGNDIAAQVTEQRRRLDDLDRRIIDLVVERASVVRSVARVKRTVAMDIIDVARETEIVELLRERAAGRLPEDELDNFIDALRELMQGVAMEREH